MGRIVGIVPRLRSGVMAALLVLASLSLLSLVAACGEDAADPAPAKSPAAVAAEATATPTPSSDIAAGVRATPTPTPLGERPAYGGVINFARKSNPRNLDPHGLSGSNYNYLTYNSLVQQYFPYDPSKGVEYEAGLAAEWNQLDNGDWVLKLREGVTWHDGQAFTADDVVATVMRIIDDEAEITVRVAIMRQVWTGVTKVDDYNVILHTGGTPNATAYAFLSGHHFVQVPAHRVIGPDPTSDDVTQRWIIMGDGDDSENAVGTGPFKTTHYDPEVEWVVERYENYFQFDGFGQRLPYLNAYVLHAVPDGTRRLARFASGTVDYTIGTGAGLHPDKARDMCQATRDTACHVLEFPHGYFNTITNSESTEAFKDPKVNAASRYAQNMDEIANLAYGGRQGYMVMDRGRFPATALTVEEQYELIPWSVPERRAEYMQEARDLMVEAGYPAGFDLPLPYFSGGLCSGSFLDQYTRQVDALVEIGIRGVLECREGVIITDELRAGRFSINAPGGSTNLIDPADGLVKFHLLDSDMVRGPWRYEGQQEVDDMFRVAQKTVDDTARNEMFRDIERYIADPKWTVYPNMHTVVHAAVHGCVRNYHPGGTWDSHKWAHTRTWVVPGSKCASASSAYLESMGHD